MVNILEKLQVFNKFKFREDIHKYYCNGVEMRTSVTRFIEQFEKPFRLEYWAEKKAKEENIPTEEMLERWASKGRISQILGTAIHGSIELLFNNKLFSFNETEIKNQCKTEEEYQIVLENYNKIKPIVDQYYSDAASTLIPVRLEMVVGDEELGIAGCLDGLFWNKKTRALEIFDYKSNEKFKTANKYQKLIHPFDKLEQTSFNIYSIQLSIYKYFIEQHTGLSIGACWAVHFDRTQLKYEFYRCLDLTKEVEIIFDNIRKQKKEEIV